MKNLCIVGTGGFAKEVVCLLDDLNQYQNLRGFFEPDDFWETNWKDKTIMGLPVLPYSDLKSNDEISIGIGNSKVREKIIEQLGKNLTYLTLIHPNSTVSKWSKIGIGSIITAGCIITSQIEIGDHSQLNLHTTIGHDCTISNYFTTAPGVNISGNCDFQPHVYFGTGAATRQGINICSNVTIGMGAMVVKNISEPGTYIGIPAKKIS